MVAERIERPRVAANQRRNRRTMQRRQMIALEKRIDAKFPVDSRGDGLGSKKRVVLETVGAEVLAQSGQKSVHVDLERPARQQANEDHPMAFARRKRKQPVSRLVDSAERALVRDPGELAVEPVGPAVVRAGEGA